MEYLSFCSIYIHENRVAEIVINGDTVVSVEMIEKLFSFLKVNLGNDVSVLLNRAFSYTYKQNAVITFSKSSLISNLAVVVYDQVTKRGSEIRKERYNASGKVVEIFGDREEAFMWLQELTLFSARLTKRSTSQA